MIRATLRAGLRALRAAIDVALDEPRVEQRPTVGPWEKDGNNWYARNEQGREVAHVYQTIVGWLWRAAVPDLRHMGDNGLASREEAKAAARAVLATWADVSRML